MSPEVQSAILWVWLIASTFAIYGLVALWATNGRRHWFFRQLIGIGFVSLPLSIGAGSLVLALGMESVTVLCGVAVFRTIQRRRSLRSSLLQGEVDQAGGSTVWQLSLIDVLTVVALIAIALGVLRQTRWQGGYAWREALVLGPAFGLVTLASAWATACTSKWWIRLVGTGITIPTIGLAIDPLCGLTAVSMYWEIRPGPRWWHISMATGFLVVSCLAIAQWNTRSCGELNAKSVGGGPFKKSQCFVKCLAATILVALLAFPPCAVAYRFLVTTPIPDVDLQGQNIWLKLNEVGAEIDKKDLQDPRSGQLSLTMLRRFARKNEDKLAVARTLLDTPCWAVVDYDQYRDEKLLKMTDTYSQAKDSFVSLALGFYNSGILEAAEGHHDEAARRYLEVVRLCESWPRGGTLLFHFRPWASVEIYGLVPLESLQPVLTADICLQAIAELKSCESTRESLHAILQRDRAVNDRMDHWESRLVSIMDEFSGLEALLENSQKRRDMQSRRLLLALAMRCYYLDHGNFPQALGELTPQYLDSVPLDPFSGSIFVYRRLPDGFLLYSIGPNGRDDGGLEKTPARPEADDLPFKASPLPPVSSDDIVPPMGEPD